MYDIVVGPCTCRAGTSCGGTSSGAGPPGGTSLGIGTVSLGGVFSGPSALAGATARFPAGAGGRVSGICPSPHELPARRNTREVRQLFLMGDLDLFRPRSWRPCLPGTVAGPPAPRTGA